MNHRAAAVVATAVLGLATPSVVFACPGMYACVPNMCTEMERAKVRNQTGPGTANAGLTFNSMNMTLLAQVPLIQMGGTSTTDGSSLHAWVDPLTKREYALMGRTNGTSVIDVTNPTQPLYVANIPSAGSNTQWREPKVYQNTAYIGVDTSFGSHRLQYVDLTQVRNYSGTTMQLTNYGTYTGANVTKVHTVGLNADSGYLYLSGTNLNGGAPHIVDIRNPNNPVAAGNVPGTTSAGWDGYSHENQVVMYKGPDAQYRGREIMMSSNGSRSLSVIDVTNKLAPARIASRTYTGARYIHQGWFTEDQRYFFQNDELDEPGVGRTRTHLWDMQDLDNPVYRGFYQHAGNSVDHNLYVKGNFLYEANYTTGVRVFQIGDLASTDSSKWLTEVAFFDTYMPSDGATFNGAWNVYPYLPSGNILVSDIDGGLFVLRASLPQEGGLGDQALKPTRFGNNMGALVPEPGSASLLIVAAAGLALRRRRD